MSALVDNNFFYSPTTIDSRIKKSEYNAWNKFLVPDALLNQNIGMILDNTRTRHFVEKWTPATLAEKTASLRRASNIFAVINTAMIICTVAALILAAAGSSIAATVGWSAFLILVGDIFWAGVRDNHQDEFGKQKIMEIQNLWHNNQFNSATQKMPNNNMADVRQQEAFFRKEKATNAAQFAEVFAKLHLHFSCQMDPTLKAFHAKCVQELNALKPQIALAVLPAPQHLAINRDEA